MHAKRAMPQVHDLQAKPVRPFLRISKNIMTLFTLSRYSATRSRYSSQEILRTTFFIIAYFFISAYRNLRQSAHQRNSSAFHKMRGFLTCFMQKPVYRLFKYEFYGANLHAFCAECVQHLCHGFWHDPSCEATCNISPLGLIISSTVLKALLCNYEAARLNSYASALLSIISSSGRW